MNESDIFWKLGKNLKKQYFLIRAGISKSREDKVINEGKLYSGTLMRIYSKVY